MSISDRVMLIAACLVAGATGAAIQRRAKGRKISTIAQAAGDGQTNVTDVLRAQRVELVDADGRLRVILGATFPKEGGITNTAQYGLVIFAPDEPSQSTKRTLLGIYLDRENFTHLRRFAVKEVVHPTGSSTWENSYEGADEQLPPIFAEK